MEESFKDLLNKKIDCVFINYTELVNIDQFVLEFLDIDVL